jgi:hypothetical protein
MPNALTFDNVFCLPCIVSISDIGPGRVLRQVRRVAWPVTGMYLLCLSPIHTRVWCLSLLSKP